MESPRFGHFFSVGDCYLDHVSGPTLALLTGTVSASPRQSSYVHLTRHRAPTRTPTHACPNSSKSKTAVSARALRPGRSASRRAILHSRLYNIHNLRGTSRARARHVSPYKCLASRARPRARLDKLSRWLLLPQHAPLNRPIRMERSTRVRRSADGHGRDRRHRDCGRRIAGRQRRRRPARHRRLRVDVLV